MTKKDKVTLFTEIDTNGNGRITKKEIEAHEEKTKPKVVKKRKYVKKLKCNCKLHLVAFNGEHYVCQYCGHKSTENK